MKLSHLKELSQKQELIATIRMFVETMPNEGPSQYYISLEGKGEISYQGPIIGDRLAALLRVYGDKEWTAQQRFRSCENMDFVKVLMNGLTIRILDQVPLKKDSSVLTYDDFAPLL